MPRIQVFVDAELLAKLETLRAKAEKESPGKISVSAYCRHVLELHTKRQAPKRKKK
jgi:hypothetical protein